MQGAVRQIYRGSEYIEDEVKHAGPRVLCLEFTPEHMTGKLVNES